MHKFQISHKTIYDYASPVVQSHHLLHMVPRPISHQSTIRNIIDIEPTPTWRQDRLDYFGNPVTKIAIETDHKELSFHSLSDIEVYERKTVKVEDTSSLEAVTAQAASLPPNVVEFLSGSTFAPMSVALRDFARPSFTNQTPVLLGARDLMERIYSEFRFDPTATDISTPVATVLEQKAGVCQDFAHLQIAALRSIGVPARYVSGYIVTHPADGQPKLIGADASHAWVSVWAPETGWVDFDPTNNLINSADHITVAVGRDYEDVSPIAGVLLGGGEHSVKVSVHVENVLGS